MEKKTPSCTNIIPDNRRFTCGGILRLTIGRAKGWTLWSLVLHCIQHGFGLRVQDIQRIHGEEGDANEGNGDAREQRVEDAVLDLSCPADGWPFKPLGDGPMFKSRDPGVVLIQARSI